MAATRLTNLGDYLADVVDEHSLEIPFNGRTYIVPPPDADRLRWCEALWEAKVVDRDVARTKKILDDLGTTGEVELTLGADVVQQMTDDGVPQVVLREAAAFALTAWTCGPRAVERLLEHRAQQREQAKTTTTKPASKAGTTKTRQTAKKRGA